MVVTEDVVKNIIDNVKNLFPCGVSRSVQIVNYTYRTDEITFLLVIHEIGNINNTQEIFMICPIVIDDDRYVKLIGSIVKEVYLATGVLMRGF